MTMENILNVMASSMSAESIRMNVTASNMANTDSVGGTEAETYRAKHAVFAEVKHQVNGLPQHEQPTGGVRVRGVIEGTKPLNWKIDPGNPQAGPDGKVYLPDVNPIQEMADMISASRQYQASVDVMNTTKSLLMKTIEAISV